eukprot:Rmarinus@m.4444
MDDMRILPSKKPITLVIGYLGSGKTTLLDRIKNDPSKNRVAVVKNEFFEDGIRADPEFTIVDEDDHSSFNCIRDTVDGCYCCKKGSFAEAIKTALKLYVCEQLLMEASALAVPTFIKDMLNNRMCTYLTYMDCVICVVDAKNIGAMLDRAERENKDNEATLQIKAANRIVINKIDLVTKEEVDALQDRIFKNYSTAPVFRCSYGDVDLKNIFDLNEFDYDRQIRNLKNPIWWHQYQGVAIELEDTPVVKSKIFDWLQKIATERKDEIPRIKAVVNVAGSEHQYVFQAVYDQCTFRPHRRWPYTKLISRFVFIGKNIDLDELMDSFEKDVGVRPYRPGFRGEPPLEVPYWVMATGILLFAALMMIGLPWLQLHGMDYAAAYLGSNGIFRFESMNHFFQFLLSDWYCRAFVVVCTFWYWGVFSTILYIVMGSNDDDPASSAIH